jgi:hypothetical protein
LLTERRYFPYFITVGSLSILFILGIFWLIGQRRLLPAIVMVGGFMFFILWLVGLVVVAIQLFGPDGSIQSVCDVQVFGRNPKGTSEATMAWLQQRNICTSFLFYSVRDFTLTDAGQSWQLVFAMALTGTVFFIWVMIMAYQVFVNS